MGHAVSGLIFLLVAAVALWGATRYWLSVEDGAAPVAAAAVLSWTGLAFLIFALTHLGCPQLGAALFAKNVTTGQIPTWRLALFAPYVLVMRLIWLVRHSLSSEDPYNRVHDTLYVGRFVKRYPQEFPSDCRHVVDLTGEWSERRALTRLASYRCIPCMDNELPDPARLAALAAEVAAWDGPVYVHCANGHGRSAALAAAVMLVRGQFDTFAQAFQHMRKARPAVGLHAHQLRALQRTGLERGEGAELTARRES